MGVTEKQAAVINFGEGNILVSASAGSGKTFVMIERLTRLILEGKADLDEILCVTFTVSAAKEMKKKLAKKINEKIADGVDCERLLKQLELLPTAQISTMHSFCKNVLSEFFYEAGLDASFSVMDEKEAKRLVKRAIDRLFEDLYEQNEDDLNVLLPLYFKKRSDADLKNKIVEIYNELISESDPIGILERGEFFYSEQGVKEICRLTGERIGKEASAVKASLAKTFSGVEEFDKLYEFYKELDCFLSCAEDCSDYDRARILFSTAKFRFPTGGKTKDEDFLAARKELSEVYNEQFKPFFEKAAECYSGETLEKEVEKAQKYAPVYSAFARLVKKFSQYYEREKREENAVDFSDLEHLCLKLLAENPAVRESVSGRYKYVFADEYQDTNGVQEEILKMVAPSNLFMVGDVKQSIYNFRGCNPDIFADKFARYAKNDGGTAMSLDCNFRSAEAVLNAVNSAFSCVMTEDFGRVDYASSLMTFGGGYPSGEGETRSYFFLDREKEKQKAAEVYGVVKHLKKLNKSDEFAEGQAAVELIESILGEEIYDLKTGAKRKISYGDVVILLRNTKGLGDKYARELARAGIPVIASTKQSAAAYPEICFLLDLIKLINCFNQDVPLVSVLKSAIGGVTDEQLFAVRQSHPDGAFFEAYAEYLQKDDELAQKLRDFDGYFRKIRLLSAFLPCDELLSLIIREKGIDVNLLAGRSGERRLARMNAFIEAAGAKKRTVVEFLPYMQGVADSLSVSYSDSDAVKITSIHNSKGLEYPVVILGGLDKRYNTDDLKGEMIIDRDFGLGLKFRDEQGMRESDIILRKYLRLKKSAVLKEEESRLLYVATTRAKNRLYFLCGAKTKKGELALPFKQTRSPLSGLYASCYADLLSVDDAPWTLTELDGQTLMPREVKKAFLGAAPDSLTRRIRSALCFNYPSPKDTELSLKRSVTAAAKQEDENVCPLFEYDFAGGATDEKTGTAYHRFLELCDFSKDGETQLNGLIASGFIEKEQASLIKKDKLESILKMSVFKRIEGFDIYREQPFTCYMPANLTEQNYSGGESVLVQGIIDLLAVKGNSAVIFDYKYTALKKDENMVARYKKQTYLYKYAVEKVLKKRVDEVWLVNLYACRAVRVDDFSEFEQDGN